MARQGENHGENYLLLHWGVSCSGALRQTAGRQPTGGTAYVIRSYHIAGLKHEAWPLGESLAALKTTTTKGRPRELCVTVQTKRNLSSYNMQMWQL